MSHRASVLGSGPGGLAIAADLARGGFDVTLGDLPEFPAQLDAVREAGGVTVVSPWHGREVVSVAAAASPADALAGAELAVVSVPALAHERFAAEVLPRLGPDAALLFMGEGGGALVAWAAMKAGGNTGVLVGETNCLPFIARSAGPGAVTVDRKRGGVLLAAIPSDRTTDLLERVAGVWPFVEAAESVFETTLVNYDAIDTVPVAVANAGTLEGRTGGMLLWGEGATPSVVRLIEALDGELLALRRELGHGDRRRYRDLLIDQGLAPDAGELFDVMRAGGIVRSFRPSGSGDDLEARLALEVPWSLALASSIGRATGTPTPVIDGLIAVASAMVGRDLASEGRTLASLGLDGLDGEGLRAYARTG